MPRLFLKIRLRDLTTTTSRPPSGLRQPAFQLLHQYFSLYLAGALGLCIPEIMAELLKKARSSLPAAMSLPPAWLKSYEEFVTKNASQVSQIESALHSISYIIPGLPFR